MSVPLVSICCITYNHEPYIRECIEGFLMQKTTFPFEILIHDDASTDNTANIIREYEAIYPDIIKPIYQTENQYSKGVYISATYNYPRTKGKYIAICEGDDYWCDPLKLQHQVDFLEMNKTYGLVYTKAKSYDNSSKLFIGELGKKIDSFKEFITCNHVPTLTVCLRKELLYNYLREVNPKAKNWKMGDYPIWLYFYLNSKIHFINRATGVYRVLKNSASHSPDISKNVLFIESTTDIKLFYTNISNNKNLEALILGNYISSLCYLIVKEGTFDKNFFYEKTQNIKIKTVKIIALKILINNMIGRKILRRYWRLN